MRRGGQQRKPGREGIDPEVSSPGGSDVRNDPAVIAAYLGGDIDLDLKGA